MRADKASRSTWGHGVLLTAAMAFSMLPLFLLGALGPHLVADFGIPRPLLGVLVTAGFGVAAVLSLVIGPVVAAIGPRRCLVLLFAGCAVVLGLFAAAPGYVGLVAAVALSGVPQALANPVTNRLIVAGVPADRRATVTGLKQSGVQFGAFLAGLPVAAIAAHGHWRPAVWLTAVAAVLAAGASLAVPADSDSPRWPRITGVGRPTRQVAWLAVFSVLLGSGIAAVNTYVALFATQELGSTATVAGALVAVLGVAGIVGRIGWSRVAARHGRPAAALAPLAVGAVLAALALAGSATFGAAWAWLGVIGVGGCAVAANAVSMVTVVATATPDRVGPDSATVSAGFFAGFAAGPPLFGTLVDAATGHYQLSWALVGTEFLAAAILGWAAIGRPVRRTRTG